MLNYFFKKSLFYRIAYGSNSKLLPHDDPTDTFFTADTNCSARKRKANKEKQKTPMENNSKMKNKKENVADYVEENPPKKQKIDDYALEALDCTQYLRENGFRKENCLPDGNCFFHALEFLTGESQISLRQALVTQIRVKKNLYNELFTEQMKMKYFVENSSLEARCQIMAADKSWAGFPEKVAASHFLGKNIWEIYENNSTFYWNVFFGTMDPRVLEQNRLENVYLHYDSITQHFSPLTLENRFTTNIQITNIYCLLAEEQGKNAVFIHMSPMDLSPNHQMFQNYQYSQISDQPVGLINMGNTCYLNALVQSLHALPVYMNAISIDRMHIQNGDSFIGNVCDLFDAITDNESLNTMAIIAENVLEKIRKRFKGQFIPGRMEDPQELLLHIQMMINEEQKIPNEVTIFRNVTNLAQTMESFQNCNRSNITRISTIYTKVIRIMHSACQTEAFEALPFLVLQFNDSFENSTTIEAMMNRYVQKRNAGDILRCSTCNLPRVHMTQEIFLEHLPEVLILTVER